MADGVAYAPHLGINVKAWGVDWYGFSMYKTWGPHMAALYGSHAAFEELKVRIWCLQPVSRRSHAFCCCSTVALLCSADALLMLCCYSLRLA